MKDFHLHYTGSLPRKYLYSKFMELSFKKKWGDIKTYDDFCYKIDNSFSKNVNENVKNFEEIYSFFQYLTKPKSKNDYFVYKEDSFSITDNLIKNNFTYFNLIAGPTQNIDTTYLRLKNMIEGIKEAEKMSNKHNICKITLTFIRDKEGCFKNYSPKLLKDLFILLKDSYFKKMIYGFDISGKEEINSKKISENILILQKLSEYIKQGDFNFITSLHAGENISENNDLYYDYFEKLLKSDIQKISHGTFLWYDLNNEKKKLLKAFASNGCIFDICPKSNLLLTPLKYKKDIPIQFFREIGLKYFFNRDNPSIFGNIKVP